ncbi:vitamin K epoxide reductase family protein [Candidatus Saccharibacteria bacterium]|nr:vitamin K epoxide reductase family protein [Candidatus Saccharibacteria bacterium]
MYSKLKEFFFHEDRDLRDNRWIFASMLVGSVASLIAALVLSIDAFEIAKNPNVQLSCSINAVVNCATVAKTTYASLLGFPNSFLGLISEPVVITVAVAGLFGVKFPRQFMFVAQLFYTAGFIFAYYLFFIGLTVIHAVCPWCLLVTLSTTFVLFSVTRYNIREGNLYLPDKLSDRAKEFISNDYDKLLLMVLVFAIFTLLILNYGSGLFA